MSLRYLTSRLLKTYDPTQRARSTPKSASALDLLGRFRMPPHLDAARADIRQVSLGEGNLEGGDERFLHR